MIKLVYCITKRLDLAITHEHTIVERL